MSSNQPTKRTKGLEDDDDDDDVGIAVQNPAPSNQNKGGSGTGNLGVTNETIGNQETSEQQRNSWNGQQQADEQKKRSGLSLIRASHPGAVPVMMSDQQTIESGLPNPSADVSPRSSAMLQEDDQRKKGELSRLRASHPGASSSMDSDQVEFPPSKSFGMQQEDGLKRGRELSLMQASHPGASHAVPNGMMQGVQGGNPANEKNRLGLSLLPPTHPGVTPISMSHDIESNHPNSAPEGGNSNPTMDGQGTTEETDSEATPNPTEITSVVAELVANDMNDVVARQVAERLASERLRIQNEKDQTPLVHGVTIDKESEVGGKHDEDKHMVCGMKPFVLGVLLLIVLGVVGGVLAAVLSGGKDEKSPSLSPSIAPTAPPTATPNPRREYLEQVLLERVISLIPSTDWWWALLDDPNSAESQALSWMSENDTYYGELESVEPQFLAERFALAVLYFSTSGSSWSYDFPYLDNSTSVCDWNNVPSVSYFYDNNGASCTDPDNVGIVTYLALHEMRLRGTIPWEIGLLNSLTSLYMESNLLSGTIPTFLNELSSLRKMWIYGNLLTGQIPEKLPSTLEHLHLRENELTGTMASEWAEMIPSLDVFAIGSNRLRGTIPTEIGTMSKLSWLEIEYNDISGTIPTELGLLSSLTYLYMHVNNLTGTLPSEIGKIDELQYFWISENCNLTGTVPTQFEELNNLKVFTFHYTSLTGSVDSIFCSMEDTTIPTLRGDCVGVNPEIQCSCCAECYVPTAENTCANT